MRILIVTAFQPSSQTAGQVFTQGLVSALAASHEVRVIYFTRSRSGDPAPVPGRGSERVEAGASKPVPTGSSPGSRGGSLLMQGVCQSPLFSLLNWAFLPWLHPLYTRRFSLPGVWAIAKTLRDFGPDILYFDFSQTFAFSLFFRAPQVVLMAHDVQLQRYSRRLIPDTGRDSRSNTHAPGLPGEPSMAARAPESGVPGQTGASRKLHSAGDWQAGHGLAALAARLELAWIRAGEGLLLRHPGGKHILTLCDKDACLVTGNYGLRATAVTPFVGAGALRCPPSEAPAIPTFCLFASWARADNVEGLSWYFERVHAGMVARGLKILVIGAGMDEALRARIEGQPGVEVLGFVDDPYPLLAQTTALLAPLFSGAGIKFKVLEALACGTPVIGTDIAFEGIDELEPGDFFRFSTAADCAAAMLQASGMQESAHRRSSRARLYRQRLQTGTPDRYLASLQSGLRESSL